MSATEAHGWLLTQVGADLDLARDALAGCRGKPWTADEHVVGYRSRAVAVTIDAATRENAAHIAAQAPDVTIMRLEGVLRRLERHAPDGDGNCRDCLNVSDPYPEEWVTVPWPCPDYLDDAAPYKNRPGFPEELRRGQ